MTRKPIFDAVRAAARPGLFNDPGNVLALDNLLDAFDVPRDAALSGRQISDAGIELIKQFEGLELKAYPDPGSGGDPWTIGYGHTGPDVKPGRVITEAEAEELLRADLARFEKAVAKLCPVTTDNQFAALVSFTFNVGEEALRTSTLRRLHNEGDYDGAAAQFARWNRAAGRVLNGLVKRRAAEAALYRRTD